METYIRNPKKSNQRKKSRVETDVSVEAEKAGNSGTSTSTE